MKIKNFKNPLKMYKQWSFKRKLQKIKRSVFKRGETFYIRFTRSRLLGLRRSDLHSLFSKRSDLFKKILVGFILVLVAFGVYFLFFYTSQVLAEWWDTNWHYRKAITITNNSGSAQTDFQVLVTADTSDTAKFQAGCDDLRFTSVNGQALDYWIESGCGTASTKIWVKVASIPAGPNGIATIYMYYGNPNAGAGSNTAIIPTSCSNINAFLGDGVYYIDPDGVGGNDAFQTYCDMTVNSGGWTMVGSLQDVTNRPIRHAYDSTDQWGCRGRWRDKTTTGVLTTANTVDYKNPAYWLLSANNTMFYMGFNPSSLTPSQWKNDSVHIAYTTNNFLSSVGGNFYNMFNDYYTFIHCDTKRSHGWCQPVTFDKGSSATIRSYMGTNSYNETAATSKWCFSPDSQTGDNSNAMGVPGIEVIGWNTEHYSFSSDYQHNCGEIHSWGDSGESSWSTGLWSFDPPNQYIYVMFFYRDTVPVSVNISAGTPAAEEKSPGPVAYWSFDEGYGTTTQDHTTNNNDGTISGAAAWQTEDMCVSGKCLWFDGSNDYVSIGANQFGSSSGSVSLWFKPVSGLANSIMIFGHQNGENRLYIGSSAWPRIYLGVANTGGINSGQDISYSVWQHVVLTYNNGTWVFYYNSKQISTGSYGGSITFASPEIGDDGGSSWTNNFKGFIDEVKIYDYARTAAQVKADYNAQGGATSKGTAVSMGGQTSLGGLTSLSDGLVGYWKMDESSGSAVDSSGNGNTGTWNGTGSHYVAGKFGNGGGFNGTDDYIEKNSPSIFPSTAITTAFWIKTADSGDGIISYASTGGDNDWLIFNSGNIAIYRAASYVTTNIAINDNNWHHIVVTWRSSDGETKLYKDGAQVYSYTLASGTAITSGGCLDIAAEQDAVCGSREASQYHNGKIDEVRIYNRALSAAEVRQLYEWAPGPVGWWKMDEASWSGTSGEVKDFSGYGNNGTRGGNATTYSPGKYGKAGTFDGADDYVQATHNNSLNITNQITLEAWIKLNSLGSNKAVVAKGGWSTGYILHFDASYEGGTCDGDYGIQTYTTSAGGQFEWCNQPSMATNTWYHVAYTYDGTTEKAYHNGDLIQTKTSSGAMLSNTSNLYIGNVSALNEDWHGLIDDVRIYNYARTQKQILEDMNAGRPAQKSPVGYWKFDEGYGTSAKDSSGYGNNGTLVNLPTWTNNGKFGKALNFNGSSNYVSVPHSDSFNFGTDNFSISTWIKTSTTDEQGIYSTHFEGAPSFIINLAGNRLRLYMNDGVSNGWFNSSITTYTDNQWHHATWVINRKNSTVYFYLDSNSIGSDDISSISDSVDNESTKRIGDSHSSGLNFDGFLDEVKIYNYALTEDEVKAEYNAGKTAVMGATKNTSSTWDDGGFGGNPPIAEWNFEEHSGSTAYDSSGNGNNGTITGATYTVGKIGSALDFDGENEYVKFLDSSSLDISSAITMSAWVKPNEANQNDHIISKKEAGGYCMGINIDGYGANKYNGMFYINGTYYHLEGTSNVVLNKWTYVVMTFDGTNIKIYVDGILENMASHPGSIGLNNACVFIGVEASACSPAANQYFNGKIDQVRIYNYARTPAQIAWDYNHGAPIAHYKMDKGEGATIYDSSGNGNNGTLTLGSLGQTSAGSVKIEANTPWYNGRLGKQNYSLNFDGDDDYVSMGSLLLNKNNSTISLWFIVDSGHSWADEYLSLLGGVNWGYSLLGFYNNDLRMESDTNSDFWMQYNSNTEVGKWYHLIVSANGTVKSYLNGKEIDSRVPTNDVNLSNIARSNTTSGHYFPGQIDDVRIYNYALTADQVKTVYNMGAAHLGTGD